MAVCLLPLGGMRVRAEVGPYECGPNATYVLSDDGTLTISGTGKIKDSGFAHISQPIYYEDIKKLVIDDGITEIGSNAFEGCWKMQTASLPGSLTVIGSDAFRGCEELSSINLPSGLTTIGKHAFYGNHALSSITFPASITTLPSNVLKDSLSLSSIRFLGSSLTITGDYPYLESLRASSITVKTPHGFTVNGDTLTNENVSSFFKKWAPDSDTRTLEYFHTLQHYEAQAATCQAEGNIEYWGCAYEGCGKMFSDSAGTTEVTSVATEKLSHSGQKVEAVAPTCVDEGHNAYWECTSCHNLFKTADCKEDERTTADAEKLSALGHNLTAVAAKAANCVENGNSAYWKCEREGCGKWFSDAAGSSEITDHNSVITTAPDAHVYDYTKGEVTKEPAAAEDGVISFKCTKDASHPADTKAIPKDIGYTAPNGEYKLRTKKDVSITINCSNAEFDPYIFGFFKSLKVNDKEITLGTDYTAASGSVKITLKSSYLEKLSPGKYTVEAVFSNRPVSGTLTVKSSGSGSTPSTGDDTKTNNLVSGMILFMLSLSFVAYSIYADKLSRIKLSALFSGEVVSTGLTEDSYDDLEDIIPDEQPDDGFENILPVEQPDDGFEDIMPEDRQPDEHTDL